ncbi:MAG TPA: right-handed parallel beta-helix repeat-containing protein [Mucilaginibacter sp.]|jgi:hypothetical protein|nr:right-handed parallel beta-helix repeat-containing protein [Mucilaginibacter sp.]
MKTIKTLFRVIASKTVAIPIVVLLLTPLCSFADDTAALQALLNAGPVTLPAGHAPYAVSGNLNVMYAFNLNGNTINSTVAGGGTLKVRNPGVTVSNGTITGTWTAALAGNPNGASGIAIYANNCTVTKMVISNLSAYGIAVAGAYVNPTITYNTITQVGYIAFFYDPETVAGVGGTFSYNTVDRSMLPPATVQQVGVGIRGSTTGTNMTTNWSIVGNVIKMPLLPASDAAECMEIRTMGNSVVSGNTFIGGSIGASAVRCTGIAITSNKFNSSQREAIEFANCTSSSSNTNTITSSAGDGILIDGSPASSGIVINGDIISGATNSCIHAFTGTKNVTISGCTLTAVANGKAVNLQGTSAVNITSTAFNGNSAGSLAVMLDTCPGNLTINGGTISNFTKCVVAISNTTSGLVTDYVTMSGVTVNGVPNALSTYVANGGAVGSHITVVNH